MHSYIQRYKQASFVGVFQLYSCCKNNYQKIQTVHCDKLSAASCCRTVIFVRSIPVLCIPVYLYYIYILRRPFSEVIPISHESDADKFHVMYHVIPGRKTL